MIGRKSTKVGLADAPLHGITLCLHSTVRDRTAIRGGPIEPHNDRVAEAHSEATLISTIAIGFVLAFGFGYAADRLRLPPLVGYLLAGVLMGPYTPGFVADGGSPSSWPRSVSSC